MHSFFQLSITVTDNYVIFMIFVTLSIIHYSRAHIKYGERQEIYWAVGIDDEEKDLDKFLIGVARIAFSPMVP